MKKTESPIESGPVEAELLPGERVVFESTDVTPTATDEELNRRYVKGDIRIVTETARYSLAGILAMLQETIVPEDGGEPEPRYKLDPEYQRRHRWSDERKSRLIESFLMNVPVPPVFLYERDLARFEVMDGRQRLTAIRDFYDDKFELKGLQHWPELIGRTYSKLPSKVRDGIDRRYISSIILLQETASTPEKATFLKKLVFERLNSGGVALSAQETRNAVYDGPLNRLCLELSKNANFRAMWRIPQDPSPATKDEEEGEERDETTDMGRRMFQKMDDVELVLRFFAYPQLPAFSTGLNKITAFLDRFLMKGNEFSAEILQAYRQRFEGTISLLWELLGKHAFCRMNPKGGGTVGRPTKVVYDPLMFVASRYHRDGIRQQLVSNKEIVVGSLKDMYREHGDLFAGRRTNAADTQQRNEHVAAAFQSAVEKLAK